MQNKNSGLNKPLYTVNPILPGSLQDVDQKQLGDRVSTKRVNGAPAKSAKRNHSIEENPRNDTRFRILILLHKGSNRPELKAFRFGLEVGKLRSTAEANYRKTTV